MPINRVVGIGSQEEIAINSSSSTTVFDLITSPSEAAVLQVGDLLIAAIYNALDGFTVASGYPGWTLAVTRDASTVNDRTVEIWWRIADSADVAGRTYRWTKSSATCAGFIMAYRGDFNSSTPIAASGGSTGTTGATKSTPSLSGTAGSRYIAYAFSGTNFAISDSNASYVARVAISNRQTAFLDYGERVGSFSSVPGIQTGDWAIAAVVLNPTSSSSSYSASIELDSPSASVEALAASSLDSTVDFNSAYPEVESAVSISIQSAIEVDSVGFDVDGSAALSVSATASIATGFASMGVILSGEIADISIDSPSASVEAQAGLSNASAINLENFGSEIDVSAANSISAEAGMGAGYTYMGASLSEPFELRAALLVPSIGIQALIKVPILPENETTWGRGRPIYYRLPGESQGYQKDEDPEFYNPEEDPPIADWLTTWADEELIAAKDLAESFYVNYLNPDTCFANSLDWLAQFAGFTGVYWDSSWAENVKRELIKNAFEGIGEYGEGIWELKGSAQLLRWLIDLFGINATVYQLGDFIVGLSVAGDSVGGEQLEFYILVARLEYLRTDQKWHLLEKIRVLYSPLYCNSFVCYDGFYAGFSVAGEPLFNLGTSIDTSYIGVNGAWLNNQYEIWETQ